MRFLFLLFLSLCSFHSLGQITTSTKWGIVSKEEMDFTSVSFDRQAPAVVLYEEGTMTVEAGFKTEIYKRIKILNEEGIEAANQEIVYYSGQNPQSISNFSAQTINTTDGKIKITPLDNQSIFDQDLNQYWRVKKFTFPDIKVGSIIEFKYTLLDKNLYFAEAWRFQHQYPTIFSTYSITNQRTIDYKVIGVGEKLLEYFTYKKPDIKNRWTLRNLPSYNSMEFIYNKKDMSERILLQLSGYATRSGHFSDHHAYRNVTPTWKSLNSEIISNLNYYKNNSTARQIAKSIPDGKDELETLLNVYSYFRSNYKWNQFYGIQARQFVKDVAQNRSGNSAELNLLLNQVLESKGLKTELVILSGRNNGKLILTYPYLGQFNGIVNLVKFQDSSSYLIDASNLTHELGFMPLNNYNHFGMVLNPSKEEVITLQPPVSEYHSQQNYYLKDNKLLLTRTDKRNGYFKQNIASELPKGEQEFF